MLIGRYQYRAVATGDALGSLVDEGFYIFLLTEMIYPGTARLYYGKTGTWYGFSTSLFLCPTGYAGSAGGIGTITHSFCGSQAGEGGRCGGEAGEAGRRI